MSEEKGLEEKNELEKLKVRLVSLWECELIDLIERRKCLKNRFVDINLFNKEDRERAKRELNDSLNIITRKITLLHSLLQYSESEEFGYCIEETCGEKISPKRLLSFGDCRYCVDCLEEKERAPSHLRKIV